MERTPSQIYLGVAEKAAALLTRDFTLAIEQAQASQPIPIFFRADDIGVVSDSFAALLKSFQHYQIPLCLAVVPAWITASRWSSMRRLCDRQSSQWCWHQHGWTHTNHEVAGKKCEFGRSRASADIEDDILRGKERLQDVIDTHFSPIFTPPWNRCSENTLQILKKAGFKAVSRYHGATPESAPLLADFQANVDLHTRKEPDYTSCLSGLSGELKNAASSGRIGMMIHHQRMNENAFIILDSLLACVAENDLLRAVHFNHLLS